MCLARIPLVVIALCLSIAVVDAGEPRSYTAGAFALDIGSGPGLVHGFEGGALGAVVVQEPFLGGVAPKHVGKPMYEPIVVQTNFAMPKPLRDWIGDGLAGKATRHSGSVSLLDYNYREQRRVEFSDALLSSLTFPGCDAASRDVGYLSLGLTPDVTRWLRGDGGRSYPQKPGKVNSWIRSNFRLIIGGVDCTRVSKIDSLTIKQVASVIGDPRLPAQVPAYACSNLVVTLPEANSDTWLAWYESFVIAGQGNGREKTGTLVLLAPNLSTELCVLTLNGLGIFGYAPDGGPIHSQAIRRVVVSMYCESISAEFPAAP